MPTPPRGLVTDELIDYHLRPARGVLPSKVAALITRLRNSAGPSRAGANTSEGAMERL